MEANFLPDVIEYAYTHGETRQTTGYFSCEPQNLAVDIGNHDVLSALLRARPLDIFLRRKLLLLIRNANSQKWLDLAEFCIKKPEMGQENYRSFPRANIAALLLECCAVCPPCMATISQYLPALQKLAQNQHLSAQAALTAQAEAVEVRRLWSDFFNLNIHQHRPLKNEAPHAPLYSRAEVEAARAALLAPGNPLKDARAEIPSTTANACMPVDPRETVARALSVLEKANLLEGPEMRHEASLSPIALLRRWRINIHVDKTGVAHSLKGIATAYGRGLSLVGARAACLMEVVERACAYADVERGGRWNSGRIGCRSGAADLLLATCVDLSASGARFYAPYRGMADISRCAIHWFAATDSHGKEVFVPAQAVFLFCNLGEAALFDSMGSTGLGAGNTLAEAKLSALAEAIERDAHACTPFSARNCFRLASRDSRIQGLLDDYSSRRIYPVFQDIGHETGLPVYRCFVTGLDGKIAQATGASLNGRRAAISALTETPWPYSWATPAPFGTTRSAPPAHGIETRWLEDLPDYGVDAEAGGAIVELAMLERVLEAHGRMPIYADISRTDLEFPVVRAFVPGFAADADFDVESPPDIRLVARM